MKVRIIIALVLLCITFPLINACGKKEEKSGHFSFSGGGGDMNFEQQALKMEQDDLAKLDRGEGTYAEADHGSMKGNDFAKIHEGIVTTKTDPNEVLAVVNGENIIRLELDRVLDKVKDKVSRSKLHIVERRILDDLITQLLLKQFIRKQNIKVDPNRIENEIKKFRENLKKNPDTKDKSLETVLEEQGGSIEELRVALDISFSIDDYLEKTVTEEEMREYFTENIGNFNGETVTASHILIDTRNIKDKEKLKKAKERIDKIKEELDKGADFAELAEKKSNCPSARNGGQLGTFGRGEMVKEFTGVAFATDVDSISEPVKTQFGYHIIKVTDRQEGKDVKFEEVADKVKIALFNEKTIDLIEELNKNATVQVLFKPTPYPSAHAGAGGHGSMPAHGGSFSGGPHWSMPSGDMPQGHGDMPKGHGGMPPGHGSVHDKPSEKSVEGSFSLSD